MTAINSPTNFPRQFAGWCNQPVAIAPLITFRILFGVMMFLALVRFWYRGWIEKVYITPKLHFYYTGFEWVKVPGATGMYILFVLMLVAALCIALGLFYRLAASVFALAFTYIELLDVTTYLNHYYFVSLVSFLLIWLPANRLYSLDSKLGLTRRSNITARWTVDILKFQMGVVYFFAGIAKLNADWLLHALPLRIWLPATSHLPLVGSWVYEPWMAYMFSWFGALYDLFIVFFLLNKHTRRVAYFFVVVFHVATAIFFPGIGLFPYIMIVCSLIFCSPELHQRLLTKVLGEGVGSPENRMQQPVAAPVFIILYAAIQLALPFRYLLYPGHLFWHEQGYRFSWRVMLMEKSGIAFFKVKDKQNNHVYEVTNGIYLTPLQEKMMSTQPDLILKFAHHLANVYRQKGVTNPKVYGEVYVSLNGARNRLFIDSTVDLAAQPINLKQYKWVLPYKKEE